jgi:hypothetical protein
MGLFDFFSTKRNEPVRPSSVTRPSSTSKREQAPLRLGRVSNPKKESFKVSDTKEIEKNLKVLTKPQENEMTFYCPIRNAKIYCHSVLIDKLGDLTKFVISSIHEGHTIEEICALTQMGNTTINEELDYLIRGGLMEDDKQTLTELGKQYGVLIKRFSELSEGIDVAFNTFADKFEVIEEDQLVSNTESRYILESHFIPALTRNDNYSNSLEIAKNQIESEMPFCREIKKSLYSTVRIEGTELKYRPVYLRDFSRGYSSENEPSVRIAIPYVMVVYKLRYKMADEYRDVMPRISNINEKYDDLLSDKAKLLLNMVAEEDEAETITVYINTITGQLIRTNDDLCGAPNDPAVYVLDTQPMQLGLDEDHCKGLYLQEISRKHFYQLRFFPYSRMEV